MKIKSIVKVEEEQGYCGNHPLRYVNSRQNPRC